MLLFNFFIKNCLAVSSSTVSNCILVMVTRHTPYWGTMILGQFSLDLMTCCDELGEAFHW